MKQILLLSGKQGSGKTTQSGLISKIAVVEGYVPRVFKFAEPLYELHKVCLPILKKYKVRPETMMKDGELLQILGTEYGRKLISENVWVDACKAQVLEWCSLSEKHIAIIDDCRFENEFDAFPDAVKVFLDCPESVRKTRCSYWRENVNHVSETGLDNYIRKGKFSTRHSVKWSTELAAPHVVARGIWDGLGKGF